MAASPRRTSLLLPCLVLLLILFSFSHAARAPASLSNQAAQVDADGEEAVSFSTAADERCESAGGADGEEEACLMRRTLVAHTDYIYTQGGNHN